MAQPVYLTYEQTAMRLGVSTRTVHRIREDGGLTAYRFRDRTIRFKLADVLAFEERAGQPEEVPQPVTRRRRAS